MRLMRSMRSATAPASVSAYPSSGRGAGSSWVCRRLCDPASPKQIEACAGNTRLVFQQLALERQAAAIARETAIGADHPVTGHDQGDRIGAIGLADRAR